MSPLDRAGLRPLVEDYFEAFARKAPDTYHAALADLCGGASLDDVREAIREDLNEGPKAPSSAPALARAARMIAYKRRGPRPGSPLPPFITDDDSIGPGARALQALGTFAAPTMLTPIAAIEGMRWWTALRGAGLDADAESARVAAVIVEAPEAFRRLVWLRELRAIEARAGVDGKAAGPFAAALA